MKRILLSLLLLLPALSWADNVPVDRARSVAEAFLASGPTTRGGAPTLELVWDGETAATRAAGAAPAFWVFNRTDRPGFVVIAGDDCARPVLGWSETFPFATEGMPDNVKGWFAALKGQIDRARESGRPASDATRRAWASAAAADYGTPQLGRTTALWDQTVPYNNKAPEVSGTSTRVTGCVMTAMGIIMKHHSWPDSSVTATTPAYSYQLSGRTVTIPAYNVGHDYDWNKMPEVYIRYTSVDDYWRGGTPLYSAEEADEVATLMRECGMIAQASYWDGETGAYAAVALLGMQNYMKYDRSAVVQYRAWYDDATWDEMMQAELRDNGPVFYGGSTEGNAGHQFVLYDYTDTGYFGLNWGWGGLANGWYLLSALDPDYYGTGGGSGDPFTKNQSAAIGLRPDKTGTSEPAEALLYIDGYGEAPGFTASTDTFEQGKSFSCSLLWIYNALATDYHGSLRISLCDHEGNVVQEQVNTTSMDNITIEGDYALADYNIVGRIPCTITEPIRSGYRLRVFYTRGSEWVWARGRIASDNSFEVLVGGEVTTPGMIEAQTRLEYDRASKMLTVQTIPGVAYSFEGAGDVTLQPGTLADGKLVVALGDCPAGTYTLTLTKDEDSKTLRIVIR